jgi:hypothetical protein
MCPIRQCAKGKRIGTCADCAEMEACSKLAQITAHSDEARASRNTAASAGMTEKLPSSQSSAFPSASALAVLRTI